MAKILRPERNQRFVMGTAFAVVLALQVYLVFAKSVNWDEFFHFQHIYQLRTGTLARPLQIFYVHYLSWLFDLPFDPVRQLQVGRLLLLLLCEPVIALAIFALVRRFAGSPTVAAFCALAYVTGGYVFSHIFAFRPDAQATALLMAALWLFSRPGMGWAAMCGIGLLIGSATILTIKSGLYAPAFLGLYCWQLQHSKRRWQFTMQCIVIVMIAALVFAGLFLLHGQTIVHDPMAAGRANLTSAAGTVFSAGLFPQAEHLLAQMHLAPVLAVMLVMSPLLWVRSLPSVSDRIALAGLLAPVASVLLYRNSYPYNFVFILAPASVTIFPAMEWLLARVGRPAIALVLVLQPMVSAATELRQVVETQRTIVAVVHRLFPQPVAYVDFCGMVADFPRVFPFLTSGWGLADYRVANRPLLAQAMAREVVPLVIANHAVLKAALHRQAHDEMLLPQDVAALQMNFVHHWGPIWVAGKRIAAGKAPRTMTVRIPGLYTVEGADLTIDGTLHHIGETIILMRGSHAVRPDPIREAILRWGNHLPIPRAPGLGDLIYTEY